MKDEMSSTEACSSAEVLPGGLSLSVGVLCIQGAFKEHVDALERLAEEKKQKGEWQLNIVDVRKPAQLDGLDGLIIPGGESTTLSVFLSKSDFESSLRRWLSGGPSHSPGGVSGGHAHPQPPGVLWGTCAGLILIANTLTEQKRGGQVTVGGLDVECSRNIYGRQISSFEAPITLHSDFLSRNSSTSTSTCHGIFIRAPGISRVTSPEVKVLGTLEPEGTVVAVQQRNLIATTFHPELTTDTRWHEYFIHQVIQQKKQCTLQ